MNELVKVDPKEFGLEESKANELTKGLKTILAERDVLIDSYVKTIELEITEENIPVFKELRLQIRDNRTKGIEPWHKVNKAFFWNGGKFVDSIKNKEVAENERMEAKLMEAEKHFENLEKKRISQLEYKRYELCKPFVEDESLILPDLGVMPDSLWENYLIGLKASYEAKMEAEKKAEEERKEAERLQSLKSERETTLRPYWNFIPENHPSFESLSESEWSDFLAEMKNAKDSYDKEQDKIRKENERLQKEADEKEAKRQKEIKAQQAKEEKEIALHKAGEARREMLFNIGISIDFETCRDMDEKTWSDFYREKNDWYQSEQNRIHLEKMKEIKDKKDLEAKLKSKEDAERKAKELEEAKKQAELNKGDAAKVKDLIADLESLKAKYSFKSAKNKKMYMNVGGLLDKVVDYVKK